MERFKSRASQPVSGTDTVNVYCKLPHGMVLRIFEEGVALIPMGGTMVETKVFNVLPTSYTVNGNAHPQDAAPHCHIFSGYAVTRGIPKDHWDLWEHQNRTHPAVINKLIFAAPNDDYGRDKAWEHRKQKTGLERLDPNNLPHLGNKTLRTADEQAAEIGRIENDYETMDY